MEDLRGPTPISNWIIKDVLLASSYPAKDDPVLTRRWMDALMKKTDINMFVSLMEPGDRLGLLAYEPYVIGREIDYQTPSYLVQAPSPYYDRIVTFANFPIRDRHVTTDANILALAEQVQGAIEKGYRVLIHCKGGKGRTGTLISILLCRYYGYTAEEAMKRVYHAYNFRERKGRYRMRLTKVQQEQIRRICSTEASST